MVLLYSKKSLEDLMMVFPAKESLWEVFRLLLSIENRLEGSLR